MVLEQGGDRIKATKIEGYLGFLQEGVESKGDWMV